MRCLSEERFLMYTNGLLGADELLEVRDHLSRCRACSKALESERLFDEGLKSALREDYRSAKALDPVIEMIRQRKAERPRTLRWFAVTGGFLSALAIFNSIALVFLAFYYSDFSIARVVVNISGLFSAFSRFFALYVTWLSLVSATLYAAVMMTAFLIFFAKKTALKPVKI